MCVCGVCACGYVCVCVLSDEGQEEGVLHGMCSAAAAEEPAGGAAESGDTVGPGHLHLDHQVCEGVCLHLDHHVCVCLTD